MESKVIKLADLLTIKPRNGLYKGKEFQGKGSRWIKMNQVFGNDFFSNQETETIEVTESEIEKFGCVKGDLLFGRTSLTLEGIGDCLLIREVYDVPIFESNLFRLRFDQNKAYPLFYYYYFKSYQGKHIIQTIAKQTAATSITANDLIEQYVPLFSLLEQKRIAYILGALDDKIELNREMNQTLEQMAQALFKSWFVDFDPVIDNAFAAGNPIPEELQARAVKRKALGKDRKALPKDIQKLFPDEFEYSDELEKWVPLGWKVGLLDDLFVLQRGFDLPKKNRTDGKYPLIAASGQDGTHNEAKVSGPGVTTGRSGKIGDVIFVHEDFWPLNTTLWVKEYKNSSPYHAYLLLKNFDFEPYTSGSAVPTLNRNHIHSIDQLIPDIDLINNFSSIIENYYKKIQQNNDSINHIITLRDTLLPKLISGEVRVPEVEKMID